MSTFRVKKKTIIVAANTIIKVVEERRKQLLEEGIAYEMFKKWFPAKTRKDAIKRLNRGNDGLPDYVYARGEALNWAKGILKLCKLHTGEHIELNRKDTWWVNEGLEALEILKEKNYV